MSFRTEREHLGRRIVVAQVFVCTVFALIGLRLWYLQGIKGAYYRDLSENNRTRTIRTASPRGMMFDREGRLLVRNRAAYDVGMLMEDTPDPEETIYQLAALAQREPVSVLEQFKASRRARPFEPRLVLTDVARLRLARIKVNTHLLPGVVVSTVPTRLYPNHSLAAQIFGYTREISREQLQSYGSSYRPGDQVGQAGLEKQYESVLKGKSGYIQVEVDARGTRRGELGILDESSGSDLQLTLDLDLQRVAERAMTGWRGAVVALDPNNGEILAIASTPTFDANVFSGRVSSQDWKRLANDKDKPLRNRAIASIYPPGSTMKLLWALAGLQEKLITANSTVYCPGFFKLGGRRYHCHKRGGHGYVNLSKAITVSCNVYFYELGQALGIDRMSDYLAKWGFGKKTGIDLPGEEKGVRPSRKWKRKVVGEQWYPGDTIPVSIGQGYLSVTPLQIATAIASLANGGDVIVPHLVRRIDNRIEQNYKVIKPQVVNTVAAKPEYYKMVREAAAQVVEHRRGTGQRVKFTSVRVGGKTGTAQVRAGLGKVTDLRFQDHAWFVSFAPVENPQIVVVVLMENAGHGGSHAAPVAREVLKTFFHKKGILAEEDWLSEPQLAPLPELPAPTNLAAGSPATPAG